MTGERLRVRIGLVKTGLQLVLAVVISAFFIGNVVAAPGRAEDDDPLVSWIAVGALSTALLVGSIVSAVRNSGRYLEIDELGITYVQRRRRTLLPWREIVGVGAGFAKADLATRFSYFLPSRTFRLDVYMRDHASPDYVGIGRRWRVDEESELPGLPSVRLRFGRFDGSTMERMDAEVRRHRPALWLDFH